jgi:primosomal protein N''
MADTSSYYIEERLVASVWVRDRQHTGQTLSQVMAAFRERFNKAPPRRATLLDWEKRTFVVWVYGDFSATL